MPNNPNRVTEQDVGLAMMQALMAMPNKQATVRAIKKALPKHLSLSADDQAPSVTRKGESMWEQQVRNQKSHDKVPGNVIFEGFVDRPMKGVYRLTPAGQLHLQHKKLI
jgi:hypothetical protein